MNYDLNFYQTVINMIVNNWYVLFSLTAKCVLFQERYKNDMNLAIQLLQCKPDNFVSQKLDNVS